MVGNHKLHPKVAIGCAGNLSTDGAIVNRVSTPMQSRMVHYVLGVDWQIWSNWASSNKLAMEVISYINHAPDKLHVFDPNHNDHTFSCPRTWKFASDIMLHKGMSIEDKRPSLAGCLGEGVAYEFITYCEVYKHIPTYAQIKLDPKGIRMTDEPMMLVALSGMVGAHLQVADLKSVMHYVRRMPLEFQIFTLRDAIRRTPDIKKEPEITDWITVNSNALV